MAAGDERDAPAQRTSPYPLSRLSAPHDLVEVAREIQVADAALAGVTVAKLRTIAEQIRALQAQAGAVLEAARHDSALHHATCNFQKRVGQIYHLYRRADGSRWFSMLSPEEWGTPKDAFEGSYRLEPDMTWTPVEAAAARDEEDGHLRRLLSGRAEP
jgi:hypothetical protein